MKYGFTEVFIYYLPVVIQQTFIFLYDTLVLVCKTA
jgi:hypothetical protein